MDRIKHFLLPKSPAKYIGQVWRCLRTGTLRVHIHTQVLSFDSHSFDNPNPKQARDESGREENGRRGRDFCHVLFFFFSLPSPVGSPRSKRSALEGRKAKGRRWNRRMACKRNIEQPCHQRIECLLFLLRLSFHSFHLSPSVYCLDPDYRALQSTLSTLKPRAPGFETFFPHRISVNSLPAAASRNFRSAAET